MTLQKNTFRIPTTHILSCLQDFVGFKRDSNFEILYSQVNEVL